MLHRILTPLAVFVLAAGVSLLAAPKAHAVDYVRLTSPANNGSIPLAPGSVGATGRYLGPAGTIVVEIYAAKLAFNGVWVANGPVLTSGSTTVTAAGGLGGSKPFAVTLNSPATVAGEHYAVRAVYKDTNGNLVDTSADNIVTSQ